MPGAQRTARRLQRSKLSRTASVLTSRRRYDDVSKRDLARFAALQINRARLRFAAVERTTGNAGNLASIDDRLAVQDDGHGSTDQRDVIRLPLPGDAWRG